MYMKALLVMAGLCVGLVISAQSALAENSVECDSGFGAKVPVLMVHGLGSNRDMWTGKQSMIEAVKSLEGIRVVKPFDYRQNNHNWVTHPAIGLALARQIDCLAKVSLKGGGSGKVIIVAHSMGGLATRYAASQVIGGVSVGERIGLVVTLGTPHLGSGYGTLCRYVGSLNDKCDGDAPEALATNSDELKALPKYPTGVPVRAIAGHVTVVTNLLFTSYHHDMKGDKVVGIDSATKYHTDEGKGGGVRVYTCQGTSVFPGNDASCEHGEMLKAPYIQEGVTQGIQEYLDSTRSVIYTFQDLTMEAKGDWEGRDEGWKYTLIDPTKCDGESCSSLDVYRVEPGTPLEAMLDHPPCSDIGATNASDVKKYGDRQVGGKRAQYYETTLCSLQSDTQETLRYWIIDGADVMIQVHDFEGRELQGVDDILANATWN